MRANAAFLAILSMLIIAGIPLPAHAAHTNVPITVDIAGQQVSGNNCVTLSSNPAGVPFANGKIIIFPNGGNAVVEVGDACTPPGAHDDHQSDRIRIKNAKIMVTDTGTNMEHRIAFSAPFVPAPAAGAATFRITGGPGGHELRRSAGAAGGATGDWAKSRGTVEANSTNNPGQWTQITTSDLLKVASSTSFTFYSMPSYLSQTITVGANRKLRGEIWFMLKQTNDELKIGPGGILIHNFVGGPPQEPKEGEEEHVGYEAPPGREGKGEKD